MELIDVEQFRLGGTGKASAAGTLLPPPSINTSPPSGSHQTSQRLFVKGPIPLRWLTEAARLPGKSPIVVGVALFHLAGLKGTRSGLALCPKRLAPFGLALRTVNHALRTLENAGLVTVDRASGRCPQVTILTD